MSPQPEEVKRGAAVFTAAASKDQVALSKAFMPLVFACEDGEGRLVMLFTDGLIRVVEVREDVLMVQQELWERLSEGQNFKDERGGRGGDDDGEDADDGEDPDPMEGRSDAEGEGPGKGRGKGGTRGKGKGKGLSFVDFNRKRSSVGKADGGGSGKGKGVALTEGEMVARRARARAAGEASSAWTDEGGPEEDAEYTTLFAAVENEVNLLRVVLQGAEAKERERVWHKGQTSGDLDDGRLVDGAIGESNVFKRRGPDDAAFRLNPRLPKRLQFVVDCSSSMSAFNGDQRLDRLCAVVLMVMEAFQGLGHKFKYAHAHAYTHACIHTCAPAHINMGHKFKYAHAYTHACIHTCAPAHKFKNAHAYTRMHAHMCTCTQIQVRTRIHTRMHTHMRTCTHQHTYTYAHTSAHTHNPYTISALIPKTYALSRHRYSIAGHSGATPWLNLVSFEQPPTSKQQRMRVVREMIHHSATCNSGDHTLDAAVRAITEVTNEQGDDYFVFVVSDANLEGYGVPPERLADALTRDARVNAHMFFIAEEASAQRMQASLPPGRAHVVVDTTSMPLLFKNIFASALASGTTSRL
jgi:hypothetical protein